MQTWAVGVSPLLKPGGWRELMKDLGAGGDAQSPSSLSAASQRLRGSIEACPQTSACIQPEGHPGGQQGPSLCPPFSPRASGPLPCRWALGSAWPPPPLSLKNQSPSVPRPEGFLGDLN